jgi:hypothetical protein
MKPRSMTNGAFMPTVNVCIQLLLGAGVNRRLVRHALLCFSGSVSRRPIVSFLRQELEAILLCDPEAIAAVRAERGIPVQIPQLTRSPELLDDPKRELVRLLGKGRLGYTKVISGQIAERAATERLRHWSESYRRFQLAIRL